MRTKKINGQKETEIIQSVKIALNNFGTVNKNRVVLSVNSKGTLVLFFSYETIVSFVLHTPQTFKEATIKNYWSKTTGKLLNECEPDHKKRLDEDEFKTQLAQAFNLLFKGSFDE